MPRLRRYAEEPVGARRPMTAPLTPNRQLTEEEVRQLKEVWEKMCRGEIISPNPRMHWLQRLLRWWR